MAAVGFSFPNARPSPIFQISGRFASHYTYVKKVSLVSHYKHMNGNSRSTVLRK